MTNSYPDLCDMTISGKIHAKKWSNCIYIAITFEVLVQNQWKLDFRIALVISFLKIHTFTEQEGKVVQGGLPHRSFENRWRNIDILYIILKGIVWRFRFIIKFSKIFWFREFMSKFSRNDSPIALERMSEKKLKLLKYEHIIYHFKARDLEIPLT